MVIKYRGNSRPINIPDNIPWISWHYNVLLIVKVPTVAKAPSNSKPKTPRETFKILILLNLVLNNCIKDWFWWMFHLSFIVDRHICVGEKIVRINFNQEVN